MVLLPLVAMAARVRWRDFGGLLTSASSHDALKLSLQTSATTALLCLVLGVPMALRLARVDFPGLAVVRSIVLIPLVLPPVVGGIALLYTFGRQGLIGRHLEVMGIQIAFSTTAVEIGRAHV